MIDYDFSFLQPETIEEAYQAYRTYTDDGKRVMYFGGGTEFISRSRHGEIAADIIIDIKHIPDCQIYELKDGKLSIGAGVTLSTLTDHVIFPLLSTVIRSIATRTARNKITLGGNLCSNLPYKEAYLPFMLAESTMIIATEKGLVQRSIEEITELQNGEFIVQIITDEEMTKMPFSHIKRTRQSRIGYPIVTMATIEVNHHLRVAMSGLCDVPIRSMELEEILNMLDSTLVGASERGLKTIPKENIIDDDLATRDYRTFVFKTLLQQILNEREGVI